MISKAEKEMTPELLDRIERALGIAARPSDPDKDAGGDRWMRQRTGRSERSPSARPDNPKSVPTTGGAVVVAAVPPLLPGGGSTKVVSPELDPRGPALVPVAGHVPPPPFLTTVFDPYPLEAHAGKKTPGENTAGASGEDVRVDQDPRPHRDRLPPRSRQRLD